MNLLLSLEEKKQLGLVLIQKEVHGGTQVAELNWNLKIGTQVNRILVHMHMIVAIFILVFPM